MASFRSASVSGPTGCTRASPASTSRQSETYSAFAGIISRTVRPAAPFVCPPTPLLSSRRVRKLNLRYLLKSPPRILALKESLPREARLLTRRGAGRPLRDVHSQVKALVVPNHREDGSSSGRQLISHNPHESIGAADADSVHADDDVAAGSDLRALEGQRLAAPAQAGTLGGAVGHDIGNQGATGDAQPEPPSQRGPQVVGVHADVAVGDRPVLDQLVHRALGRVDGHREPDALGKSGVAAD